MSLCVLCVHSCTCLCVHVVQSIALAPLSVEPLSQNSMGRKFTFYFHDWLLLAVPPEHQNLNDHVSISANAVAVIVCKNIDPQM